MTISALLMSMKLDGDTLHEECGVFGILGIRMRQR